MARSCRPEQFEVYEPAATYKGRAVDLLALEADADARAGGTSAHSIGAMVGT